MVVALIFMLLVVVLMFYIALPVLRPSKGAVPLDVMTLLESQKDLLLQEIQDVSQDLTLNKITQEDFDRFRIEKETALADILQQIAGSPHETKVGVQ